MFDNMKDNDETLLELKSQYEIIEGDNYLHMINIKNRYRMRTYDIIISQNGCYIRLNIERMMAIHHIPLWDILTFYMIRDVVQYNIRPHIQGNTIIHPVKNIIGADNYRKEEENNTNGRISIIKSFIKQIDQRI